MELPKRARTVNWENYIEQADFEDAEQIIKNKLLHLYWRENYRH